MMVLLRNACLITFFLLKKRTGKSEWYLYWFTAKRQTRVIYEIYRTVWNLFQFGIERRGMDLIKRTNKQMSMGETAAMIVYEEAMEYFHGDKSLDKTTQTIQKRVETYINEQR